MQKIMQKLPQVKNADAIAVMELVYQQRLDELESEPLVLGKNGQPKIAQQTLTRFKQLQQLGRTIQICHVVMQRAGADATTFEIMSSLKPILKEEKQRRELEAQAKEAAKKLRMMVTLKPAPHGRVRDLGFRIS